MTELNRDMTWSALRPDVRQAFRKGQANLVPLERGTRLCRFITTGYNAEEGNWWFPAHRLPHYQAWSAQTGQGIQHLARPRTAQTESMSPKMNTLITIVLNERVWAFEGACAPQVLSSKHPNVHYIGGETQYYLPGLVSDKHATVVNRTVLNA